MCIRDRLGEDGPTHQPIEQIASLRAIPNLVVIRPADANETVEAWKYAINHKGGPVALILTRQKLSILDQNKYGSAKGLQNGAYIVKDSDKPDLLLIGTGSEVSLSLKAAEQLELEGKNVRVISFPSWEIFEQQSDEYKQQIFSTKIKTRVSVEMGIGMGWQKYLGDSGEAMSIETFGASAPDNILYEKFGFTVENVVVTAKRVLSKAL